MSDVQFIDVDHEDYEDAPRALREAYKQLKKQYTTATAERDDYKGKWQSRSATDALADYGFRNSKRVSRDLIADGVDLSDTNAVKAWVEENGDDYARSAEAPVQPSTEDHDKEAEARSQIQDAASQVQPAGGDKMKAALAEITPDMTPAQVVEVYRKHGI